MTTHDDLLAELSNCAASPWALQAERATSISSILATATSGRDIPPARLRAALAIRGDDRVRHEPGVAIVPISGLCLYGLHLPPLATSMTRLRSTMEELTHDKSISRIILNIGSPGGVVTGVPEAADAIHAASRKKQSRRCYQPACSKRRILAC